MYADDHDRGLCRPVRAVCISVNETLMGVNPTRSRVVTPCKSRDSPIDPYEFPRHSEWAIKRQCGLRRFVRQLLSDRVNRGGSHDWVNSNTSRQSGRMDHGAAAAHLTGVAAGASCSHGRSV